MEKTYGTFILESVKMKTLQTDFGNLQIHPKFESKTMKEITIRCLSCHHLYKVPAQTGSVKCPTCHIWDEVTEEKLREELQAVYKPVPHDPVNHPSHYTSHPSGVECITVTRHMNFNLGNVMKYIWRADHKDVALQDLEKALFYLRDEIKRRKKEKA